MFNNLSTKTIAVVAAAMAAASADAATVRSGKSVRDILSAAQFDDMFSGRRGEPNCADGEKYLTYDNFVNAADTYYPEAFTSSTDEYNRRELAAFLGQISQETTGWWGDQPYNWGLCYVEEVAYKGSSGVHYATEHAVYPPAPGKSYHGRGAMQVSWNYNYGALSESLYGDKDVLLSKPELLASDGELMFRASLWFWMTPQSPKPSAHDVMQDNVKSETCRPNGFGTTTNIINGGLECSTAGEAHHAVGQKVYNRIAYYKRYCEILGVSPGEYTECAGQKNYVEAPTCPSDYVTPQDGETNENNNNGISQPFRCGINWNDANTKCGTICAVNGDCPTGEGCYSNMMNPECAIEDGDIVPPTSGPETSTAAPTTTTSSAAAPTTTSSTAAPTTTSSAAAAPTTTSWASLSKYVTEITVPLQDDLDLNGKSAADVQEYADAICEAIPALPENAICEITNYMRRRSPTLLITIVELSTESDFDIESVDIEVTLPNGEQMEFKGVDAETQKSEVPVVEPCVTTVTSTVVVPATTTIYTTVTESGSAPTDAPPANNCPAGCQGCWDGNHCWTTWSADVCSNYSSFSWCM